MRSNLRLFTIVPRYIWKYVGLFLLMGMVFWYYKAQFPSKQYIVSTNNYTGSASAMSAIPNRTGNTLFGVKLISSTEAWSVGGIFSQKAVAYSNAYYSDYIGPSGSLIWHYKDGIWTSIQTESMISPLLAIDGVNPENLWAVGYHGALVFYDGHTWQVMDSPTSNLLRGISMTSVDDGWTVGAYGTILHYNGTKWDKSPSPINVNLMSVRMISAQEGWAVGEGGYILHFNGGKWEIFAKTEVRLNTINVVDQHNVWFAGDNGKVYHYDGSSQLINFSTSSARSDTLDSDSILSIQMFSDHNGWIFSKYGNNYTYQEPGLFSLYTLSIDPDFQTIYSSSFLNSNNGMAIGFATIDNASVPIAYTYNGKQWNLTILSNVSGLPSPTVQP